MKILIIMPNWLGDIIISLSLIAKIKKEFPNSQVDILIRKNYADIAQFIPEIANTFIDEFSSNKSLSIKLLLKVRNTIKEQNYTHAFILPNSFKSALIPFLAKIPTRIGYLGEMRFIVLNKWIRLSKVLRDKLYLMADRYYYLSSLISQTATNNLNLTQRQNPKLLVNETTKESLVDKIYNQCFYGTIPKIDSFKFIISPGAAFGQAKQWPSKYYAKIIDYIIESGHQVFIVGSKQDIPVANELCSMLKNDNSALIKNLCGYTSLVELISLISICDFVICNDSGVMNVAAALDKKVVAIFGPTSPKHTPPMCRYNKVEQLSLECQPCFKRVCPLNHHNCMEHLPPERIIESINQFL